MGDLPPLTLNDVDVELMEFPRKGPPGGGLQFVDALLCRLVRSAPCHLVAEATSSEPSDEVDFLISAGRDARATVIATCQNGVFRGVLARLCTLVLTDAPYGGHSSRRMLLRDRNVLVITFVNNEGLGGFWVRMFLSPPDDGSWR